MKYMRLRIASLLFIGPLFSESTYSLASALGNANPDDLNEDISSNDSNFRTIVDMGNISELDVTIKPGQRTIIPAFTTEYGIIKQKFDD